MNRKVFIFLFLAPVIGLVLAGVNVYYHLNVWRYEGPEIEFHIKSGENFSKINYRLYKRNIISSAKLFHRYAQFTGVLTKFKSGNYIIKTNSNMLDIMGLLLSGKARNIRVTIPEGKNIFEIGMILENKGITKYEDFIKFARDRNLLDEMEIPAESVEGYLYPNTYQFQAATAPRPIIKKMVQEFYRRVKDLPFENSSLTPHEVIILASIVEKETGAGHERPIIAGVFLNRLKRKMRLQSDPTTIYGIYEQFDGNLKRKHLQMKTPYNTYKISGLPKGPISNPGIEAIGAVLGPTPHKYLYFVSQNDGTHIFSENYKKHSRAVNKYQKNSKNRLGKSWRDLKKVNQ